MGHQEDIVKTESKIIVIRDTQVILDRDVAELYGVTTKEVNQALKNNPTKFPFGYVIELTSCEKEEVVKKYERFSSIKYSTVNPHAFTESGLFMLATILKSPTVTQVAISIINTFTQLRKLARSMEQANQEMDLNLGFFKWSMETTKKADDKEKDKNRVDVGELPPAPLIAPYVRVSYTALHTYRRTQTLIQSIRVDQARSALAFICPIDSRQC